MERAATVCARFADLARAHGATRFVTVATAATREARNGADFVRLMRETAGLEVHVVSGKEEARLIYLGLLSRVHVEGRALVIDIGGGSTEVAVGDGSGADVVESISLGAIRLARRVRSPTTTAGTTPTPTKPSSTACASRRSTRCATWAGPRPPPTAPRAPS